MATGLVVFSEWWCWHIWNGLSMVNGLGFGIPKKVSSHQTIVGEHINISVFRDMVAWWQVYFFHKHFALLSSHWKSRNEIKFGSMPLLFPFLLIFLILILLILLILLTILGFLLNNPSFLFLVATFAITVAVVVAVVGLPSSPSLASQSASPISILLPYHFHLTTHLLLIHFAGQRHLIDLIAREKGAGEAHVVPVQCVLPGALHGSWGVQGGIVHQRRCSTETFRWQLCSSATKVCLSAEMVMAIIGSKIFKISWSWEWWESTTYEHCEHTKDNQGAQLEDWNRHKMGPFLTANCCSPAEISKEITAGPNTSCLPACGLSQQWLRLKNKVTFGHWTQ